MPFEPFGRAILPLYKFYVTKQFHGSDLSIASAAADIAVVQVADRLPP
jgi:hypothetical protein